MTKDAHHLPDRGPTLGCACGRLNPADANFCLGCGTALGRRCHACERELPSDANFCSGCGARVAGVVASPFEQAPGGVRKVVTIVFADLAGSTSLQEHMDPESVRRVMERFYGTMRAEIEAGGGVVVKFTGDGVMAGFGIREASEDDALRAVRAAGAMQESFRAFAEEVGGSRGASVSLRVGVNTGEVVVSDGDDDVVGDVVNVAARLEHAAGEGHILVGDETWRLTRHAVGFDPVEPLALKGKSEPVAAYRVVSLQAPRDDQAAAVPFVGRTAELERLRETFERSADARSPSITAVVGSPGLGKTRIAAEFASSVAERARVLWARCDAAATAAFAPVAEALRDAADIADTATGDDVVASLGALLPEDLGERARVARLAASLLGVGDPAPPQETFWAVRRLLEGLATTDPLVLVVDDVQWAEPMLLDLLDHVVEWSRDAAIVVVALARPEIREVRPSLLDAGAIVLEGLAPEDTAALASSLLGDHDLPARLVRRILTTTEGNPLFVRELLRMLVDDGVLSRDGERWVVTVEAEQIDVPPTIHALLSARIERLSDDERAVVERASVVGYEFYRGAVIELVPSPVRARIDTHLETLRRRELVEPEGTYWIDERVFRFHHVLIRDAAYRRLLKEARSELHERFADWLQAKVGDLVGEHDEVLGYHLEQAHGYLEELDARHDHRVLLGRRAAAHLASAMRRALDRDDLAAAAALSERALALADEEASRASILLDRCEALLGMGDVDAAADAVTDLRQRASDERLVAWADCFAGQLAILTDPSQLHRTADVVARAAHRLGELQDSAGAAKAHAVHAQALARLGRFGACETALDRALAAARRAGDRRRANAVLASAPLAALWGPSPVPRASGRCLDVVRVLRITAGAPAVEAAALRCQAVLEAMRGRADAAHSMLASARETLEELGLRHALVECDMSAGLIDLLSDDAASAESNLRRAYDGFRSLNVGVDIAQSAALLARALVEQGKDEEALALTAESERLGGDDLKTAIAWRTVRARVLARRGEGDAAIELARAAVALAASTDALIDHADARLASSEVLAAAGLAAEAEADSRVAVSLYAGKGAMRGHGSAAAPHDGRREPEVLSGTFREPGRGPRRGGVRAAPGVAFDLTRRVAARRACLARDVDELTRLLSPNFVHVDRRRGLQTQLSGGRAYAEAMRATWQDRDVDWDFEVLSEWAPDVALARLRSFGEGWERVNLDITVADGGLATRLEIFDEDDFDAAFRRLDDVAYERSVARPAIGRYLDRPNEHGWTDVVPLSAAGTAALVRAAHSLAVVQTSGGRVTGVEVFGPHDELAARRRLYELAPHPSHVRWLTQRYVDAHNAHDWDVVRSTFGDGYTLDDRGPLGWGRVDADATIERLAEAARNAESFSVAIDDWMCITASACAYVLRWTGVTEDGVRFDDARIVTCTLTSSGLVNGAMVCDLDQIDEARRWLTSRTVPVGPVVRGYVELFNARAWDRVTEFFAPDYCLVDHRPAGFARRDVAAWIDGMAAMVDLAPNVRVEADPVYCSPSAEVCIIRFRGDSRDGGPFVLEMGSAGRIVDGRGVGSVIFDPQDVDAAVSWATDHSIGYDREDFEALRRERPIIGSPVGPSSDAAALAGGESGDGAGTAVADRAAPSVDASHDGGLAVFADRWMDAFRTGGGALSDLYSPEFTYWDHGQHTSIEARATIASMTTGARLPNAAARMEPVVCLGERHGVLRTLFAWEQGDGERGRVEVAFCSAHRLDEHGRLLVGESFPGEHVDRALARAEELYVEDEAAGDEVTSSLRRLQIWRAFGSFNAGDVSGFAEWLRPDLVTIDHRPASFGELLGREAWLSWLGQLSDAAPDRCMNVRSVRVDGDVMLLSLVTTGTTVDGAAIQIHLLIVVRVQGDRQEFFSPEQRDDAVRRFEELARESEPTSRESRPTTWRGRGSG